MKQLISSGEIESVGIGTRRLVRADALAAYIDRLPRDEVRA